MSKKTEDSLFSWFDNLGNPKSDNSKVLNYVPLDQGKSPEKYTFTFNEWIAENGERIVRSSGAAGVLYTVPVGYVFYLSTAMIAGTFTGVGSGGASVEIYNTAGAPYLLVISVNLLQNHSGSNSLSFPQFLRVLGGESIRLNVTAGSIGGAITGFLVPKRA